MMNRKCKYLCGVLAALLLVSTPRLCAAVSGESQPAKQSIQPTATTKNVLDYEKLYADALLESPGRNANYRAGELYNSVQYILCNLIPGGPLELAVHVHTNKHAGTLYFYTGKSTEDRVADTTSADLSESRVEDNSREDVSEVDSASESWEAEYLGEIPIDNLPYNTIMTYDGGVVYTYAYKGSCEGHYYCWNGTVFRDRLLYKEDVPDWQGQDITPDLAEYLDTSQIEVSLPLEDAENPRLLRVYSGRPGYVPKMTIVLDPGHGGDSVGAEITADGKIVYEKDLDLTIAQFLKEELEKYEGVTVEMTRESDRDVELPARTQCAVDSEADLLVSLHNNAYGKIADYRDGCTVLAARGVWKEELAEEEQGLAAEVLQELEDLGIENRGILLRICENGKTYENGELTDYYAIIRNGNMQDVPSILIEHAFMDDASDYESFLADEESLRQLAQADARGIARYYGLREKETGTILFGRYPKEEVLMTVTDGLAKNNLFAAQCFGRGTDWKNGDALTWYSPEAWAKLAGVEAEGIPAESKQEGTQAEVQKESSGQSTAE